MRPFAASVSFTLASLLSTTLVGCGLATAVRQDDDRVRAAVNRFAEAWNTHDIDALSALFASDADFVQVNGVWWKGCPEIYRNVGFLHGTLPPNTTGVTLPSNTYGVFRSSTYRFDRLDVRFVKPDVAIAHVLWTQLGYPRFAEPRHGMLSFIAVRDGDQWVLSAAQNTLR